jgi:putative glycosyltransferase
MKLSIVSTLFRSEASLQEFYRRAITAAESIATDVEMVLVDDGSPDNSLSLALRLQERDSRIIIIELSRNFGHHRAMMTGLAQATGDLVFLIDSDLEEEPELLGQFHAKMKELGCDVVFGVQQARRGGIFERVSGEAYYRLLDFLSDNPLPRNLITARLMTRPYVDALIQHQDRAFEISDLWQATGFRQVPLAVVKHSLSESSYSWSRRIQMAVRQVTTTSTRLLYLIFYAGCAISGMSMLTLLYFLLRYLTHGIGTDGWTSLFVSVSFFGGTTVLILGIIGLYVANILAETKRRPYTVIRAVHRSRERAIA